MAPRQTRPSRLEDVARAAGVSTATVSRALNGAGPMTAETRARVVRTARELDYHPNWLARGLRRLRTDTIGLILPDIQNPFFTSLVKGVERAASERGWNVVLGNTDEEHGREEQLVRVLVERKIDGLLLCATSGPTAYLARYVTQQLPMVAVNRLIEEPPLPSVATDSYQGACEAVRHLLGKGYRPLGLILGTPGLSTTEAKLAASRQVAREFGLAETELVLRIGYGRTAEGYKAARELLECEPPARAIFAFNNLMAESALMAIHDLGLDCPADVALVGFDDFRSAAALSPALTVVEQYPEGMGAKAVEVLAELIEAGRFTPLHTLLPTRLLIRESCGGGRGPGAAGAGGATARLAGGREEPPPGSGSRRSGYRASGSPVGRGLTLCGSPPLASLTTARMRAQRRRT